VKLVLLAAALAAAWLAYQRLWRVPSPEELEALRREHQRLADQVRGRLAVDAEPPGAADASVVVGVPVPFAERFGRQVAARLLKEMTFTLRGLEIEKAGDLHARLLVGRSLLGQYVAQIRVEQVQAVLRAGRPDLRMAGQRLALAMPVDVVKGAGTGRIHFRWDSRGAAAAVCGDFEMSGDIAGTVVPSPYTVRAQLALTTEGPALVAVPELDDMVVTLRLQPSAESWRLLDAAIEQRSPVCRTALATADVPEKVRELVSRGFVVKLPRRLLPPVRFPVEMEKVVTTESGVLHFQVKPVSLNVSRNAVWYRTDVRLGEAERAAPAATPGDAAGTETPTTAAAPTLEGQADDEAQGLEALPAVEKHLEVRPQPEGH
jgi:hypothetical protein